MALSKFEYNSFDVTPVASNAFAFNSTPNGLTTAAAGAMNLISTSTISSGVSTVSIASSIDSTYDTYLFKLINIHMSAQSKLTVNFRDGSTAYDASKTTTSFSYYNHEGSSGGAFEYVAGDDLANGTGVQTLTAIDLGTQNDSGYCGELYLFSPSSTTFVKHFFAISQYFSHQSTPYSTGVFTAGYCNTTSAIDGIQFAPRSGNIDSGVIKMYGITK